MLMDPLCIYIYRELKDSRGASFVWWWAGRMKTTLPTWSTQVKHTSVTFSALACDPEMKL